MEGEGHKEKYRAAYDLLLEQGQQKIKLSRFMDFIKTAFGPVYDDETFRLLTDALQPDDEGYLDFPGFMKLFSGERLSGHVRAQMMRVFSAGPDTLASMADWGKALAQLGLKLDERDVHRVMEEATRSALHLLNPRNLTIEEATAAAEAADVEEEEEESSSDDSDDDDSHCSEFGDYEDVEDEEKECEDEEESLEEETECLNLKEGKDPPPEVTEIGDTGGSVKEKESDDRALIEGVD